ncbi:hypothetical protein [Crassaminicella profunda]|uniref:hypothetical protein n=1 Tax=Crassaminicella profunda TaxID=1286698 RepID=UPI001CA76336|nr:hypothetical protein [Crassaminicella profunda]QZY56680.1 hypothetical protein K7H06_07095 [Crassaminicella profunda]
MEVDKYEAMTILEALATQDEQCSRDCNGCKYEEVCNKLGEEGILENLFGRS